MRPKLRIYLIGVCENGAAKDSWFAHLAVEVPAEGASNEWLEVVNEEDYEKLK